MADPLTGPLARRFMDEDAHPANTQFSDAEINAYKDTIAHCFPNTAIGDSIDRVASDGYSKLKNYLIPIARECLAANRISPHLALAIACFLNHFRGTDDCGCPIVINEPHLDDKKQRLYVADVEALLFAEPFFGNDRSPGVLEFVAETERRLRQLNKQGTSATVADVLAMKRETYVSGN